MDRILIARPRLHSMQRDKIVHSATESDRFRKNSAMAETTVPQTGDRNARSLGLDYGLGLGLRSGLRFSVSFAVAKTTDGGKDHSPNRESKRSYFRVGLGFGFRIRVSVRVRINVRFCHAVGSAL